MYMEKIIVVGGGFSGLIAGIFAKKKENQVIILERNQACGKKILVTGNGRCNYSNEDQAIFHYHTSSRVDLSDILTKENIAIVLDFYTAIGIYPKIKNGYYYPYSNQAVTVQNALLHKCKELEITIKADTMVLAIEKKLGSFFVHTNTDTYCCDKVIMACGSQAYPKLGTDGNGYTLLEKLGHSIIPVLPALTGLHTLEKVKEMAGVRSEVSISLYEESKLLKREIGEVQFTDYGISGICAMQLSHFVSKGLACGKKEQVILNFVYDRYETKEEFLSFLNLSPDTPVHCILDRFLNYKVTNFILKKNQVDGNTLWSMLSDSIKNRIVIDLVSLKLEVIGTNSFEQAQVCCGGVCLEEINIKTMESKIVSGLYIVGEILDVDGDCGGYNITFASLSGMLAGKEASHNDTNQAN